MKKNNSLIIDILSYKFNVVLSEDTARHGREGECDFYQETIKISPSLGKRGFADTLLHEILHAINQIGLDAEKQLIETQIYYIGAVLSDVLRRNPQLRDILMP